jgi:hypothetical protein
LTVPTSWNAHGAALERLAQRLERGARELHELVQEEHASMRECSGNVPRGLRLAVAAALPRLFGRTAYRTGFSRSGWWRGSQAVTAHDLADHFDVRRAIASKHVGDISEVARAQQTRTDDCEEAGVNVAAVSESVDHAPGYKECVPRVQVAAPLRRR